VAALVEVDDDPFRLDVDHTTCFHEFAIQLFGCSGVKASQLLGQPAIAPIGQYRHDPPGASSLKFTVSSKWNVLKELEGQKNIGNMSSMGHMRSHHTGYIQWSPTQCIVFWLDMAS
jgi:hypothetical protein